MKEELAYCENLIRTINSFYRDQVSKIKDWEEKEKQIILICKGIDVFLKFLNQSFKIQFLSRIDAAILSSLGKAQKMSRKNHLKMFNSLTSAFIKELGKSQNFKIFIGKDAYFLYGLYKKYYLNKTDFTFIKYSRPYLFGMSNGVDYFKLVDLIYKNIMVSADFDKFIEHYTRDLKESKLYYYHIRERTTLLLRKKKMFKILKKYGSTTIIDSGAQGGLILPLMAILSEEGFKTDFLLLSCYNWLPAFIKRRAFTQDLFIFDKAEHEGIKRYYKRSL